MKVIVTGVAGQLGRALCATQPEGVELIALDRTRLDIRDASACEVLMRAHRPDLVVNAAAYTAVDKAETESEMAFAVNADAVAALARAAALVGTRLLHVSTDYVFDGAASVPWKETDEPAPINVYGKSKRRGEQFALEILGDRSLIVRTAWLYDRSSRNFIDSVLMRMIAGQDLRVVCDQIGAPTSARSLAAMIWRAAVEPDLHGILHWSDSGAASWYDVAVTVQRLALQLRLIASPVSIEPVPTEAYPTTAKRPRFSLLDSSLARSRLDIPPRHWTEPLADEMCARADCARKCAS